MEVSEIFRCSEGTFGIRASEVGWGSIGILEQVNECGGDCRTSSGDEGLMQTLMPSKTTSDLLDDEREGTVSSGVELVGESWSYTHSLRELLHGVHGRPASHLCPHNPR